MRIVYLQSAVPCLLIALAAPVILADDASTKADEELVKQAGVDTDGPGLLNFFKKRTIDSNDLEHIKRLVNDLGDEDFDTRESASAQLAALGARAKPMLKEATTSTDVEVSRRAKDCLQRIDQGSSEQVLAAAARLVGLRKPDKGVEVLLNYLPFAEDERVAEAVRQSLASLALKDGKPDSSLVAALSDKSAVKRAAAADALCLARVKDELPAIRKLLRDPEALVRAHAGLALAALREKEAIPVLIDLLGQVPPYENSTIEEMLYHLAADKGPNIYPGKDEESRNKYRQAWKTWWTEQGDKLDLAKLEEASKLLGCTLVVLLDKGKVLDLDKANKTRFEIGDLELPLDVQLLPGDHVLVAEHNASRVTERTKKGEIVWEKKVDSPLVAQRLPNGNTFVCTRAQLLEFDKDGKEVFSYGSPRGEQFMKAMKLRNGDYAFVCQLGNSRFVRITPEGKEIATFPVEVRTSGGRIDVTAKGNVLVPENANNRVIECDRTGKVVWEVSIEQPIAAVRLPNGNTLVTSMNQNRAVEFDRNGKEVWEYKSDTRVTRALRR